MSCIVRGATIVPHAVFDVPAVLARVAEEGITVLPGPPTLLQGILNFPEREKFDLSTLRLSVTGAAAICSRDGSSRWWSAGRNGRWA